MLVQLQLKQTLKIEKLYTYNDEYKYPLDSFLCQNLFAELLTHLIGSVAMFCIKLYAGVGYCSPVSGQ